MDRFALVYDKHGHAVREGDLEPFAEAMLGGAWKHAATTCAGQAGVVQVRVAAASHSPCRLPPRADADLLLGADLRLDARVELIAALAGAGFDTERDAGSEALLRLAYRAWGPALLSSILGDFAFVLWDAEKRELLAARDHLGVRSLYYAETPARLYVANSLDALRRGAELGNTLDDAAICDFLLCGMPLDTSATAFTGIRRLPPAHRLRAGAGRRIEVARYWQLPVEEPLRLRVRDCVEGFREVLGTAVSDRIGNSGATVSLSGGIDSATVAALAARTLAQEGSVNRLRAFTVHSPDLWPEGREDEFAALAADHLGIAWECTRPEEFPSFYDASSRVPPPPEPVHSPQHDLFVRQAQAMSRHAAVGLTGNGSDPALVPSQDYWWTLIRRGRVPQAAADALALIRLQRTTPPLYLRSRWTRWLLRRTPDLPAFPPWFCAQAIEQFDLVDRWRAYLHGATDPALPVHPDRPEAFRALLSPHWPFVFWTYSPEVTRVPLDIAHPFFDVRVLRFLLRLPGIPWCHNKWIVREAMSGILPESLRLRPKATPRADPMKVHLLACGGLAERSSELIDPVREHLENYVNTARVKTMASRLSALRSSELDLIGRPLALAWWLHYNRGINQ